MFAILVSVLAVIIAYFFLYKPLQHWKNLNVPHEKPWPFFGNMQRFLFRLDTMHEWVSRIYSSHPDKKVLGIYSFNLPILMIRDVNLIKQIGIKDFDHFVDHRPFISEEVDPLFGKNLFSLRGEKWRHMRSTLSPAFTSKKMRSMFILISECANKFTNYFVKNADPAKPTEIELKDLFTRFANDVIATTAFGIECNSLEDKNNIFYLMGKDATNFGGLRSLKFFGYQICRQLMILLRVQVFSSEVCNFFRNIIKTTLTTREKENIIRPDMIHLLMEARKGKLKHDNSKDEDAGFATVEESDIGKNVSQVHRELTDEDITAQALLFFLAGFDTISTAMCHMAYELAQHNDIQEKLQEEIDVALEENKGKVSYEMVLGLKYMDMVLCETLRMWPPVAAIDRVCVSDYTFKTNENEPEIKLKVNDLIWFPIYAIHRDPQYFPDPNTFDPERFNDENKDKILPLSYIPFGVGPRNCIGSRFALMEAKTIFVYLLSKFSFVLTDKSDVPIKLQKGLFNMVAQNGFNVGLKRRNNN